MTNNGGNDLCGQGDPGNQDSSKRQRIGMSVRWSGASDIGDQADCDRLIVPIRLRQWLRPCPWLTAVPSHWDPTTQQGQGLSRKPATSNLFRRTAQPRARLLTSREPSLRKFGVTSVLKPSVLAKIPTMILSSVGVQHCYPSDKQPDPYLSPLVFTACASKWRTTQKIII
jgi:hypothetical protein